MMVTLPYMVQHEGLTPMTYGIGKANDHTDYPPGVM